MKRIFSSLPDRRPHRLAAFLFAAAIGAVGAASPFARAQDAKPAAPAATAEALPDAQEIHAKFVKALGGEEAIRSIKSRSAKAKLEIGGVNVTATVVSYHGEGNMYSVMDIPGLGQLETGVTEGVVWQKSAIQGIVIMDGAQRQDMMREADLHNEVEHSKYYTKLETIGTAEVDGKKCYKVEFTPTAGEKQTRYYEVDSGLLVKYEGITESPEGKQQVATTISDYRDVSGVKAAFKMTAQSGTNPAFTITFESIADNVDVPADKLKLPADVKAMAEKKKQAAEAPKVEAPKPAPAK